MAESIFGEFSVTLSTFSAFLLPASARVLIRILFTVVRAVSEDEKNAESANSINKNIICDMSSASKNFTSLYYMCVLFIVCAVVRSLFSDMDIMWVALLERSSSNLDKLAILLEILDCLAATVAHS